MNYLFITGVGRSGTTLFDIYKQFLSYLATYIDKKNMIYDLNNDKQRVWFIFPRAYQKMKEALEHCDRL